jgi:hypothetical protein
MYYHPPPFMLIRGMNIKQVKKGEMEKTKRPSDHPPAKKRTQKQEIVTFKVDRSFWDSLRGIENRSEFIRAAVLSALNGVCPLCKGSGILSPDQRKHWKTFAKDHSLEECRECHAVHLVCVAGGD